MIKLYYSPGACSLSPHIVLREWLNFVSTELRKGFSPLFNKDFPEEGKAILRKKLGERLAWVNQQLEGKSYLTGDAFS